MKRSSLVWRCVVVLVCNTMVSYAETIEVKKKVECYYCKGVGIVRERVKEMCSACDGQGYFLKNNGTRVVNTGIGGFKTRKNADTRLNCRACGSRGYRMVMREITCRRCKGAGYEVQTEKKEVVRNHRPSQETIVRRRVAKRERFLRKQLDDFLETNTVNAVLFHSGPEGFSEEGCCFGCSHMSNQLDNATYKMKIVEVLPGNQVVSDLVKYSLYDQKMKKELLIETSSGDYSVNDYLKEETFYKFIGEKEYKDRFGRKKRRPCLREISKEEYIIFAKERVGGQVDAW